MSGLKVNFNKSLLVGINISDSWLNEAAAGVSLRSVLSWGDWQLAAEAWGHQKLTSEKMIRERQNQIFVEKSGDVKPPKVEVKPNIDGASFHVEASKYVKKVPCQMKLEIKEVLRQVAFPETTILSPPPRKVVDSQNPDSQPSPSPTTSSFPKKVAPPLPTSIPVVSPIDYMSKFMVSFIDKVVDVIGDGHCGFRAIAKFMGLTEEIRHGHAVLQSYFIKRPKDLSPVYEEAQIPSRTLMSLSMIHQVPINQRYGYPFTDNVRMATKHLSPHLGIIVVSDEYLDQHDLFQDLMIIENGEKPPQPKKETNKAEPILLDTPEKAKQQFEVIAEDEGNSILLDLPQSLGD
ncbi:hypothetical protein MTR_8g464140 [Medicago truncatula]|uniref:OTU domain-containing protein n=1 Tax=Medicago truncatula TaxID=3880 RepID=A0A072U192_MEDTR|nr:hypothetical protein MTR_8g464140 [Medicago truncatula]